MLKTPIILPIVRSRQWQLTQCCLLIGLVALSYWVGDKFLAVAVLVIGGVLVWRVYRRQPKGVLSLTSTASLFHGRWLHSDQRHIESDTALNEPQGKEYQVRCDYLGPWIIGLYVGKQRVWLWPDSAPKARLREVRKLFHRPGQ